MNQSWQCSIKTPDVFSHGCQCDTLHIDVPYDWLPTSPGLPYLLPKVSWERLRPPMAQMMEDKRYRKYMNEWMDKATYMTRMELLFVFIFIFAVFETFLISGTCTWENTR